MDLEMSNLKRIADILVSSWALAKGDVQLPTGPGVLDRALKHAIERGAFPADMRSALHFASTSVGLRCVELRSIMAWAQATHQISDPNPSYTHTDPKVSRDLADSFLVDMGIDPVEAERWGRAIAEAVASEASDTPAIQA